MAEAFSPHERVCTLKILADKVAWVYRDVSLARVGSSDRAESKKRVRKVAQCISNTLTTQGDVTCELRQHLVDPHYAHSFWLQARSESGGARCRGRR